MNKDLVYPHEKILGATTMVLGCIAWLVLIVATLGTALILLAVGFLAYLFFQSALIAYIKGNGVELSSGQFPDLYAQFVECCDKLQLANRPEAYILNGDGGLNAFATKFLNTQYVVLLSDIVDVMDDHQDGVRFYIGHELGHLRMKHLTLQFLRWPVLWLPLLGAAYSRARESTCDLHGLACSNSPEGAARALAVLAAGVERWKKLDLNTYLRQTEHTSGFWMSFHELTGAYPWLSKRVARVLTPNQPVPRRNGFAYVLAIFIPYTGRLGAGFGFLLLVYFLFIALSIALPAYQDYVTRAQVALAFETAEEAMATLGAYYEETETVPSSLEEVGISASLSEDFSISLDTENMELIVPLQHGDLILSPRIDDDGTVFWLCVDGEGLNYVQLPEFCRYTQ